MVFKKSSVGETRKARKEQLEECDILAKAVNETIGVKRFLTS